MFSNAGSNRAASGQARPGSASQANMDGQMKSRTRPQSAVESFRPSSAISRVGSSRRPRSSSEKPQVTSARARQLWGIVRDRFMGKRVFDPLSLFGATAPIPYTITVKHGFLFKFRLRHKHALLAMIHHSKIPIHHAEGRMGLESSEHKSEDSKSKRDRADNEDGPYQVELSRAGPTSTNARGYTFVCVDRTKTVRLWDVTRNAPLKPRATIRLTTEVTQFVYLTKHAMYAGCSHDKSIKFFNSRFELTSIYHTMLPVLGIRYDQSSHEMITIGSHTISVWVLEGVMQRGAIKLEPSLKYEVHTGLSSNEWITAAYVQESNRKLCLLLDTKILIYDLVSGIEVHRLNKISSRQICALLWYEPYDYHIIASTDGTVQIQNLMSSVVHEFSSHTKPVTALALYPFGPIVMSCSLDMTVRMYNLKTFREVYCLHLRETPLTMQVMDETQLCIHSHHSVTVWDFNHINTTFLAVNSGVRQLQYIKSSKLPPRVLARTEDGIIRLISPVSGKPLTTSLPLVEADSVSNMSYCPRIDMMYMMMDNGEVWIVSTQSNPCSLVDRWQMDGPIKEDCSTIILFDGKFLPHQNVPKNYDHAKGYCFLFGGTRNGQILIYGLNGVVQDRYQLHNGDITQMVADHRQQLLITAGSDATIKISSVEPLSQEILQLKISIATGYIPKVICVMDYTVCAASDDFAMNMYMVNITRKDWRPIPSHLRSDDHTEAITAICTVRKLGIFISASRDGTIRVWDTYNTLIREIQFQHPLESVCIANPWGDLLIGILNRIDIIKCSRYLPPGYVTTVQNTRFKEITIEHPIPFDENFEVSRTIPSSKRKSGAKNTFRDNFFDMFREINLHTSAWLVQHESSGQPPALDLFDEPIECSSTVNDEEEITPESESVVKQNHEENPSTQTRSVSPEVLEHEFVENDVEHKLFEKYLKYKMYCDQLDSFSDEWESFRPSTPELGIQQLPPDDSSEQVAIQPQEEILVETVAEAAEAVEPEIPETVPEEGAPNIPFFPQLVDQSMTRKRNPRRRAISVAPDGEIPNSLLSKDVGEWLSKHKDFKVADLSVHVIGPKIVDAPKPPPDEDRVKKSEEYKARLKTMLEEARKQQKASEEQKALEEAKVEEEVEEIPPSPPPAPSKSHVPMANKLYLKANIESLLANQVTAVGYPKIIERALQYEWLPQDLIFQPLPPRPSFAGTVPGLDIARGNNQEPDKKTRKLMIEPTGDSLLKITLDVLKTTRDPKIYTEAYQFIQWLYAEHGFGGIDALADVARQYVQSNIGGKISQDEAQCRLTWLKYWVELDAQHMDILPTLFAYLHAGSEMCRNEAIKMLETMGVQKLFGDILVKDVLAVVEATKRVVPTADEIAQGQLLSELIKWARNHLKSYLISTTNDQDVIKKLGRVNVFGEDQRSAERRSSARPGSRTSRSRPVSSRDQTNQNEAGIGEISEDAVKEEGGDETGEDGASPQVKISDDSPNGKDPTLAASSTMSRPQSSAKACIKILKNPTPEDFVKAINHFVKATEKRLAKEEAERQERLRKAAEEAERIRKEMEKRAAYEAFIKKKEDEREARNAARAARLERMRKNEKKELPKVDKYPNIVSQAKNGDTHQSKCHGSREPMMEQLSDKFPFLSSDYMISKRKKVKSMPIEKVRLRPFQDSESQSSTSAQPALPNLEPQIDRWLSDDNMSSLPPEELTYIRQGLEATERKSSFKFLGNQQFFIPDFSF
ncbi:hypothetical protein BJ742DRAFT_229573 [Cladochytrium replicatum]|nr:hypothetical protein BJ742DRAFT_229573 [Cladochytrium replicatum]